MKIVSGMRPTGKLHLGHYLGVIRNWLKLQQEQECYFFVADWHALSTTYEEHLDLNDLSLQMVQEWLACGIDPERSLIYRQSAIPELPELYLMLNMLTPLGWLERNPTYKDQISQMSGKNIQTAGFFTYPVLMSADIILFDAHSVPIGEDQKPHLEICREIVRRFHHLYGESLFVEPKEIMSETPKLLGLDGRKMSKSYQNAIYLSDTPDEVWQKLRGAKTDPQRVRKTDPGNPDVCLIFDYHKELTPSEEINRIEEECRAGTIGCVDCKKTCHQNILQILEPIQENLARFDLETTRTVLDRSSAQAQQLARDKMTSVRQTVFSREA